MQDVRFSEFLLGTRVMVLTIRLGWSRFDLTNKSFHDGEEILTRKTLVSPISVIQTYKSYIECSLYTSNFA
jgi:hypothetical protein